ncbi:hypothetical protein EGW08_022797 [Elysia chlorotica]|uniref:Fibrinogen C-terminal domain-containing protein n=1 Tax=Elysia chlorotica TaxID=188477 RepID=A0A433SK06_ELYCH|nr:hypothetical protein EGW08_022797 [Elysia chlorotica]
MRVAHCVVLLVVMTSMTFAQDELAVRVTNLENHMMGLERRVEALEKVHGIEQSSVLCQRGMGNGAQEYPPYLELSDSTLQRHILCDTHTDGGGWIVIQKRATGDVDFYRDWAAYREGFGNITGDFWLGNEALHTLTSQNDYEVRIDVSVNGQEFYATSSYFKVEDEADKYRLRLGTCSGEVGKSLCFHNDLAFSTLDRDNDSWGDHCAVEFHAGWWFRSCHRINLNGRWAQPTTAGITWHDGNNWAFPNFTEMKIRRLPASTTGL